MLTTSFDADVRVARRGNTLDVDLQYPPASRGVIEPSRISFVTFDQTSVRASGGIRISFDYKRDGYAIEQPTKFEWFDSDDTMDQGYVEVAFVPAFHPTVVL